MWNLVRGLQATGVTIILTTHYIEEAEEMAERIGIINRGRIILVEEKTRLMQQLGKKQLTLRLQQTLQAIPPELAPYELELAAGGYDLVFTFDAKQDRSQIADLLSQLAILGIGFKDLQTEQSSLEDIFVNLVHQPA
jgi:ABC-2 type transport system ATP-binding protein